MDTSIGMQKTLGAVVIGRNEGERLHNCLRSLKVQTYPADSVAIVVADNGSNPPLDP